MCDTVESYTINIDGNEFIVEIYPDYDMGLPWEEGDGYGVIEQRRYRRGYCPEKAPHEIILRTEDGDAFIYDIKATIEKAKREDWGIANPPANWTRKRIQAEAIRRDIAECRKWLTGDNFWTRVKIECGDYSDSLCGIEATCSDGLQYAKEHAKEMAQALASQIKNEKQESDYWASRDVCTVQRGQ